MRSIRWVDISRVGWCFQPALFGILPKRSSFTAIAALFPTVAAGKMPSAAGATPTLPERKGRFHSMVLPYCIHTAERMYRKSASEAVR